MARDFGTGKDAGECSNNSKSFQKFEYLHTGDRKKSVKCFDNLDLVTISEHFAVEDTVKYAGRLHLAIGP